MLAIILALILLTQLDGSDIRVEHSQVYILKKSKQQCPITAGAMIGIGPRDLCVKETEEYICSRVELYGGICERRR